VTSRQDRAVRRQHWDDALALLRTGLNLSDGSNFGWVTDTLRVGVVITSSGKVLWRDPNLWWRICGELQGQLWRSA